MGEVGAALAPCLGGAQKRPESGREVRSLRRRSCPLCRGAELRTRLLHSPSTPSSSSRFLCTPVVFWEKTDYRAPSWLFNALNFSRGHLFRLCRSLTLREPWIWPEITVEFVEKCCFHPLLAVRRSNLAWIILLDGLPLGAKVRKGEQIVIIMCDCAMLCVFIRGDCARKVPPRCQGARLTLITGDAPQLLSSNPAGQPP